MEKHRALYMDCSTGISGDMSVAALLDLGADEEELKRVLEKLPIGGFTVSISKVEKNGRLCSDFAVNLDEDNHDHDMEYLYGHLHGKEEQHGHDHHHHHHGRSYRDIVAILKEADLPENTRQIALRIFGIIADSESHAHQVSREEVHFHEVGAVDSIVDVVATAFCLDSLGVTEAFIPSMVEGRGTVRCQHGILEIPVPAVKNIIDDYHLPVRQAERQGELITPTGAAIAAALRNGGEMPHDFRVLRTGFGAGKRAYTPPSVLKIDLIEY